MKFITTAFVAIVALASNALAAAVPLKPRDVFVPPVLYPHSGTLWYVGQRHNVSWYVLFAWTYYFRAYLRVLQGCHKSSRQYHELQRHNSYGPEPNDLPQWTRIPLYVSLTNLYGFS